MFLSHVTSTITVKAGLIASTSKVSYKVCLGQHRVGVCSARPPPSPPTLICSTSSALIFDTNSPGRLCLKDQLPAAVLKLHPLRSAVLNIRISPVPLPRRQTLDLASTRASGNLSGSRCVLLAFHSQFTPEKSTVRLSGFAARTASDDSPARDCVMVAVVVAGFSPSCSESVGSTIAVGAVGLLLSSHPIMATHNTTNTILFIISLSDSPLLNHPCIP